MRKAVLMFVMLFSLVAAGAFAHGGSHHKAMGTVASIDASHISIKDTHGTTVTIPMNSQTTFIDGTATAKLSDVKPGMRVIVEKDANGAAEHVKFSTKPRK